MHRLTAYATGHAKKIWQLNGNPDLSMPKYLHTLEDTFAPLGLKVRGHRPAVNIPPLQGFGVSVKVGFKRRAQSTSVDRCFGRQWRRACPSVLAFR